MRLKVAIGFQLSPGRITNGDYINSSDRPGVVLIPVAGHFYEFGLEIIYPFLGEGVPKHDGDDQNYNN